MTVSESKRGLCARRARLRELGREERGAFTLVELVVVALVLAIALPIAGFFMLGVVNRTDDTQARTEVLGTEQAAVDRIARDIREASALTIGGSGRTIDIVTPRGRFFYDCSGADCTRAEFEAGSFGDPVVQIEGLAGSGAVFSQHSLTAGAGTTVLVRLRVLPEGRDRPIELQREVSLRNV